MVYVELKSFCQKSKSPTTGEEQEEEEEVMPHITSEDAWLFPVLGSVTLGGLYLIIKYLGPEWINWLMSWYLSLASLYSVTDAFIKAVRNLIGPTRYRSFTQYHLKLQRGKECQCLSWRLLCGRYTHDSQQSLRTLGGLPPSFSFLWEQYPPSCTALKVARSRRS